MPITKDPGDPIMTKLTKSPDATSLAKKKHKFTVGFKARESKGKFFHKNCTVIVKKCPPIKPAMEIDPWKN